ncbi:MAG: fibronectin type III domain-containing protein [Spirochaetota bacterium]
MLREKVKFTLLSLILLGLLSLACEEEKKKGPPKKTSLVLAQNETDSGRFEFRLESFMKENTIILERGKIANEQVKEYWGRVNVRWGFRRKIEGDNESRIYWMQKNARYNSEDDMVKYAMEADEDKKDRFIPDELPGALLQEKEANLEVVAEISEAAGTNQLVKLGFLDLPPNFKQKLMRTTDVFGKVLERVGDASDNLQPVAKAAVYVVHKSSGKIFQVHSDLSGKYRVSVRFYDEFFLVVLRDGMVPSSQKIQILKAQGLSEIEKDIVLTKIPAGGVFEENVLYDVTEGNLKKAASTGLKVSGLTVSSRDAGLVVPGAQLFFYNKSDKKVYFLRSDRVGKFNLKLPSLTMSDTGVSDLGFTASAYGYEFEKGSFILGDGGDNAQISSQLKVISLTPIATQKITLATPVVSGTTSTASVVTVNWKEKVPKAAGYIVYYGMSAGVAISSANKVIVAGADTLTAQVTGLTQDTKYYFKVVAVAPSGSDYENSKPSSEVAEITKIAAGQRTVDPPTNLSVSAANPAVLTWTTPTDKSELESYVVSWGTTTTADDYTHELGNLNATRYEISKGLPSNSNLYVKIRSKSTYALVRDSSWVNAKPFPVKMPKQKLSTPQNIVSKATHNNINIHWQAVPNASSYIIYYATTAGVTSSATSITVSSGNEGNISSLTANTKYYFKILAKGGSNYIDSDLSPEEKTITTKSSSSVPKLSTPSPDPTVSELKATSAKLSWSTVANASGSVIYYSKTSDFALAAGSSVTASGTSHTVTGLDPDTDYYFKLVATGGSGYLNSDPVGPVTGKTKGKLLAPIKEKAFVGSTSVVVSWEKVSTTYPDYKHKNLLGSYWVYYSTTPNFTITSSTNKVTADVGYDMITIPSLNASQQYYFKIRTIEKWHENNAEHSEPTAEISATTAAQAPSISGSLTSSTNASGFVTLRSTDSNHITVSHSGGRPFKVYYKARKIILHEGKVSDTVDWHEGKVSDTVDRLPWQLVHAVDSSTGRVQFVASGAIVDAIQDSDHGMLIKVIDEHGYGEMRWVSSKGVLKWNQK